MNLNKALIAVLCLLSVLVAVTVVNLSRSTSVEYGEELTDDQFMVGETLMANIRLTPDIVRSYDSIKEYYDFRNILIFRYTQNTCQICLDSQLNALLAFQEEIGKAYVWVLPAYPDDRNALIQLNTDLAKFNFKNIPAALLLIPKSYDESKSYFAWVNSEGEIEMVYVPDRSNVQLTRRYFDEVKRIIQNPGEN